jgi:Predicted nucleotidyltransferases
MVQSPRRNLETAFAICYYAQSGNGDRAMQDLIEGVRPRIALLCRQFHVRRLDVFGSAARGDFDPEHSDIDFLVEFEPGNPLAGLEGYFGLREALEALLSRKVDLVAASRVENPYLRRSIEESRRTVYAA